MNKFLVTSLLLALPLFANDDWDAESYYQHAAVQHAIAKELLEFLPLKENEHLLDIGCGTGKISAAIAKQLPSGSVLGIDISSAMIEFAEKHYPSTENKNLTFKIQDAQELSYKHEFDVIVSFNAIQWIQDHDAVIKGAVKALKPTGKIGITMPLGFPENLQLATEEIMAQPKWSGFFKDFSTGWNFVEAPNFRALLEKHQLEVNLIRVVKHREVFNSRDEFEQFISIIFPYLRSVPKELKAVFMGEVLDRFIEREPLDDDNRLHFIFRRLDVIASKV